MRGSRGGTEGSDPLENHKAIGFLINAGLDPMENPKSYQNSIQCWATIGPPAKRQLNVVLLVGQWWPGFSLFVC